MQWFIWAAIALLLLTLIGIPLWNRYFRKQVYLVPAQIGSDTNTSINTNPSNLSAMQSVAAQYNAEIATVGQLAAAAQAGADWQQWGWMQAGTAYLAAFPFSSGQSNTAAVAQALGCPSVSAMSVNPCLSSVVTNQADCGSPPPNMIYTYNAPQQTVSCTGSACNTNVSMNCGSAGFVADLQRLGTSTNYVYNPSTGVLLYGVKPSQGAVPFNSTQYSQFSLFSL